VRIAILGTRGIPANYGGFETFAEELGVRLAARGHEVTVYGRAHYVDRRLGTYRGVRLVVLPTVRHKYLDTVVHTAIATAHVTPRRYDVVLVCNAANALFCAWPRPLGTRVVLNVDGIERKRRKWNALGRAWYLMSERLATWLPDAVVTDARTIREYYAKRYGAETTFIPYGCTVGREEGRDVLDRFGLEPGSYVLYVSRLEPENNALAVIEGFERTDLDRRLVVVGDAPYAREYRAALGRAAGPRVVFTGAVYGRGYRQLQSHAFAYVHATEVGGTHPALVEAMGFGNCVVVNDVPENREVAGEAAEYFAAADPASLARVLERLDRDSSLLDRRRTAARDRARDDYSWDAVTDQYEALFARLCARLENEPA
jgi:glycosyltransferase involved in cell wall biosynthesis